MKYKSILFCRKYLGAGEVWLLAHNVEKLIRELSARHRLVFLQTGGREDRADLETCKMRTWLLAEMAGERETDGSTTLC